MTYPTISLTDKVAIVTGGANGIGEACAIVLARSGAHIVIADNDPDNGKRVADAITKLGQKALFINTNMMESEQIIAMVEAAAAHFGRIDILVNNVGGTSWRSFSEMSLNSIDRHIALNLKSLLVTTQAVIPHISAAGSGTIINIASTEALRAAPGFAVYGACKAAMVSFTKSMALELAPQNIRSFVLAPDMIKTAGIEAIQNETTEAEQAAGRRYIPLDRLGKPEELANLVAFLSSDMALYLNGVVIPVDGGCSAAGGWYRNPQNEWCLYHTND